MATVLLHQLSSIFVKRGHWFNSHKVSLFCSLFADNLWSFISPFFISLNDPLIQVDCYLSSNRFSKNDYISNLSLIDFKVIILVTNNIGNSSNHRPRIHNTLATSNKSSGLISSVIESLNYLFGNNLPLLATHLQWNGQDHKHMVDSIYSHCIDVRKHVGACYPSLQVWIFY